MPKDRIGVFHVEHMSLPLCAGVWLCFAGMYEGLIERRFNSLGLIQASATHLSMAWRGLALAKWPGPVRPNGGGEPFKQASGPKKRPKKSSQNEATTGAKCS